MLPDLVNGAFETCGALFILPSILKLRRERVVRGVSWVTNGFFCSWALWNLFYYPHLDQWASFAGGVLLGAANVTWLCMILHYTVRERRVARASAEASAPYPPGKE